MSTRTKYDFNNLDSFPPEIIMWYYIITLGFNGGFATMFHNSKQRIQCVGETYSIIQQQSQLSLKIFAMKQWNYIDKDTNRIEMKRNSFTNNVNKNHGVIQLFYSMNFQLQKYPFCSIQYYHIQNILLMILLGSLGCVIFWNMGYRGIPIYRGSPSTSSRIDKRPFLVRVTSLF